MTVEPTQADHLALAAEYEAEGLMHAVNDIMTYGSQSAIRVSPEKALRAIAKLRIENERLVGELAAANAKLSNAHQEILDKFNELDARALDGTPRWSKMREWLEDHVNEPANEQDQ